MAKQLLKVIVHSSTVYSMNSFWKVATLNLVVEDGFCVAARLVEYQRKLYIAFMPLGEGAWSGEVQGVLWRSLEWLKTLDRLSRRAENTSS